MKVFQKSVAALIVVIAIVSLLMNPTSAVINQDLEGRVIILDPGHGEENPNVWEDYYEHVWMLVLAEKLKPMLEARGAKVLLTRTNDNDVPLSVRCALINLWTLQELRDEDRIDIREIERLIRVMQSIIDDPETNESIYFNTPFDYTYERQIHPDTERIFEYQNDPIIKDRFLMISLHSNATPKPINTTRNGVDIYHISNDLENNINYYDRYSNVWQNAYLANLLMGDICRLGFTRQEVQDYYYFMLREHNIPAVLVENGFHTNAADRARLMDDAFLDKLAAAYTGAILYYFASVDSLPEAFTFDDLFGSL